jgi:hypothetical protein
VLRIDQRDLSNARRRVASVVREADERWQLDMRDEVRKCVLEGSSYLGVGCPWYLDEAGVMEVLMYVRIGKLRGPVGLSAICHLVWLDEYDHAQLLRLYREGVEMDRHMALTFGRRLEASATTIERAHRRIHARYVAKSLPCVSQVRLRGPITCSSRQGRAPRHGRSTRHAAGSRDGPDSDSDGPGEARNEINQGVQA